MLIRMFALMLLTACADETLPRYVNLGGLRVLALVGDNVTANRTAEFSPGDTVRVTPWVSDFRGGTRTIQYEWQACVDPGVSLGIDPSCAGGSSATAIVTGALTVPATERTGAANTFDVTVPSTILDGKTALEKINGVSYLVTYKLVASDGTAVSSFKRLVVTLPSKTNKNQHPDFTDVLGNGTSLTVFPSGKISVMAQYSVSSRESYSSLMPDGTQVAATEDLMTTWFITAGEVSLFRTLNQGSTEFNPVSGRPTDHTPLFLAVMRDGRGGVAVLLRSGL